MSWLLLKDKIKEFDQKYQENQKETVEETREKNKRVLIGHFTQFLIDKTKNSKINGDKLLKMLGEKPKYEQIVDSLQANKLDSDSSPQKEAESPTKFLKLERRETSIDHKGLDFASLFKN